MKNIVYRSRVVVSRVLHLCISRDTRDFSFPIISLSLFLIFLIVILLRFVCKSIKRSLKWYRRKDGKVDRTGNEIIRVYRIYVAFKLSILYIHIYIYYIYILKSYYVHLKCLHVFDTVKLS